jgi:formylglycine-generating enzyme required for sulfatase activity
VRKTSYQLDIGLWKKIYKYSPTGKYPIAYITWNDAIACTTWVEKRLSTEDE